MLSTIRTMLIVITAVVQLYAGLVYKGQVKDSVSGADGLWGAQCVVVSPDSRHVYVAGSWDDAISWFSRDSLTGDLTFGGLLRDGVDGADGISRIRAITISADGEYVYTSATCDPGDSAVAWFKRDVTNGTLTFGGAVKNGQIGGKGLNAPFSLVLSSDGLNCYTLGAFDKSLVWFTRSTSDGSLTYGGSLIDNINGVDGLDGAYSVCISQDDKTLYVVAILDNSISWFERRVSDGSLIYGGSLKSSMTGVLGMKGPAFVTMSPDQKNVYVASATSDALVWFNRNITGQLTYGGMFQDSIASLGGGNDTFGLNGAYAVVVSPSGNDVFVVARWSNSLTWFKRDTLTGAVSFGGTLKNIPGLGDAKWVSIDPLGKNIYVAATSANAVSWFAFDPSSKAYSPVNRDVLKNSASFKTRITENLCTVSYFLNLQGQNRVRLYITSLQGRVVENIYQGTEKFGMHSHMWNFKDKKSGAIHPGVYLCNLVVNGNIVAVQRIFLKKK